MNMFIRKIAAKILNYIAAKNELLGKELFEAVAKHTVGIAIEAVLLRKNEETGKTEVYLTSRRPDEVYPGQFHCPGTYIRAGEDDKLAFARLGKSELHTNIDTIEMCGEIFAPEIRYKTMLDRVYLIKCQNPANETGKWIAIDDLAKYPVVEGHTNYVLPTALAKAKEINWI